eukprot:CFRG2830T1
MSTLSERSKTLSQRVFAFAHAPTETKLSFTNLNLDHFPAHAIQEIVSLGVGPRVVHLDLSHNTLHDIPLALIKALPNLKILFCSSNQFTTIPISLAVCSTLFMLAFRSCKLAGELDVHSLPSSLGWLILTNNQITSLPDDFGKQLPLIRKLMLSNNCLSSLPPNMMDYRLADNLELIRIANNKFEFVPKCLFKGHKLAWLGLGGNPSSSCAIASLTQLDQKNRVMLTDYVKEESPSLGSGASGDVYLAMERNKYPDNTTYSQVVIDRRDKDAVAIKIFKGGVTSDGCVLNEVQTALALSSVKGLIPVIGYFGSDDGSSSGMVFELVRDMEELGKPPSFASVTRDVYPLEGRFRNISSTVRIVTQICNVAMQMHAHKHAHGDLYAHNILFSETDYKCYLTDLGSAYPYTDERMELVEVRAFGYLTEELCEATTNVDGDEEVRAALMALASECLLTVHVARQVLNFCRNPPDVHISLVPVQKPNRWGNGRYVVLRAEHILT